MKYWSDVVKATLYKLGINDDDNDADEFIKQMPYYANECLYTMANDLKPCLKNIIIKIPEYLGTWIVNLYDSKNNLSLDSNITLMRDNKGLFNGEEFSYVDVNNTLTGKLSDDSVIKIIYYKNSISVSYGDYTGRSYNRSELKPELNKVIMPEDFVNFSDIAIKLKTTNELIVHPKVIYSDWNVIILPNYGEYTIPYYALYGVIPTNLYDNKTAYTTFDLTKSYTKKEYNKIMNLEDSDSVDIVFNGINPSVLNCVSTYMASKISEQDDLQKATLLMNQFEVMAQRLESDYKLENEHFTSDGGWY